MKPHFRDPAFRHRLREALRITGKSQRELARDLDIHPAAVNRWLSGKTEPVKHSYEAIARSIGVPLDMIAPVVARRVPFPPAAGNFSIPIRTAVDVGSDLGPSRLETIELPEWLVSSWFGGLPVDDRASAVRVVDDSLEPLVRAGTVVILDTSPTARGWQARDLDARRVYAVRGRPGAAVMFRRVSFDDGAIICEPVNLDRKRYPVLIITADPAKVPSFVPAVVVGTIGGMAS